MVGSVNERMLDLIAGSVGGLSDAADSPGIEGWVGDAGEGGLLSLFSITSAPGRSVDTSGMVFRSSFTGMGSNFRFRP